MSRSSLRRSSFVRPLWAVLGVLTVAVSAHAAVATFDSSSEVKFQAVGPAGLKIDGDGGGLKASEAGGAITLEVPLTSLKTGISLRDEHLQKALETSKFPKATLVVQRSALTFPADNQAFEGDASAQLTLHGQTKPTTVHYKVNRTGSDLHIQGRATVDITKHGMEVPCYLGVCVEKDVKIKVKFKVRDN